MMHFFRRYNINMTRFFGGRRLWRKTRRTVVVMKEWNEAMPESPIAVGVNA